MSEITEQKVKDFAEIGWRSIRETAVSRSNGMPDGRNATRDDSSQLPSSGVSASENSSQLPNSGEPVSDNSYQLPNSGAPVFDTSYNVGRNQRKNKKKSNV